MGDNSEWVMILSCEGVKSGAYFTDIECCLQRAAEDIFGEVPNRDSDNYEEWATIENELMDSGYVRFEDGSIQIAKVQQP